MDFSKVMNSQDMLDDVILCLNGNSNEEYLNERLHVINLLTREAVKDYSSDCTQSWVDNSLYDFSVSFYEKSLQISGNSLGLLIELIKTCCTVGNNKIRYLKYCSTCISNYLACCKKEIEFDENKLMDYLKLTIAIIESINVENLEDQTYLKCLFDTCITLLQADFITSKSLHLINSLLMHVMKTNNKQKVQELWDCLNILANSEDQTKVLIILTSQLALLSSEYIITNNNLWLILQDSMVHEDPLTRKRALYVFKWLIDCISKKVDFSVDSCDSDNDKIIFWHCDKHQALWDIWKTFILLMEVFEEKQLHVIQPVLSSVNDIVESVEGENQLVHISWLLVLLRRAISHESKPLVKWAIQYTFQLTDTVVLKLGSKKSFEFIFTDLMNTLHLNYIYSTEEGTEKGSPPLTLTLMEKFFQSCLKLMDEEKRIKFCEKFLESLSTAKFNQMSYIYLTRAIRSTKLDASLQSHHVKALYSFVISQLPAYRIEHQRVVFHNLIVFFMTNLASNEVEAFTIFLQLFSYALKKKLVFFASSLWSQIANYISEHWKDLVLEVTKEIATKYLLETEESHGNDLVTLTLFLCSHGSSNLQVVLLPITDVILKLNTNPYLGDEKILKSLCFIHDILTILTMSSFQDQRSDPIAAILGNYFQYIFQYFINLSENIGNDEINLHALGYLFQITENFLELTLGNVDSFKDAKMDHLLNKVNTTLQAKLHGINKDEIQKRFSRKFVLPTVLTCKLLLFSSKFYVGTQKNGESMIQNAITLTLHTCRQTVSTELKKNGNSFFDCDSLIVDLWHCMNNLLKGPDLLSVVKDKLLLFEVYQSDFQIVSSGRVVSLVHFAHHFIELFAEDVKYLLATVSFMWKVLTEQKQDDSTFWELCRGCVDTIFHQKLLLSKDDTLLTKLLELFGNFFLLGEKKAGVVNIVLQKCIQGWTGSVDKELVYQSLTRFMKVLVQFCVFGPLHRKHEKPSIDLIDFLHRAGEYDGISRLQSSATLDQNVRVLLINFIFTLNNSASLDETLSQLVFALADYEQSLSKPQQCYYPNSDVHRHKIRCWQMVLVLLSKVTPNFSCERVLLTCYDTFAKNHQPSTRYFIEWCILLLLASCDNSLDTLWRQLDMASEKKITTVTSAFSLCIQLTKVLPNKEFIKFVEEAVPRLLPWAQAQHMTSRIHAQVVLQSIWNNICARNLIELRNKMHFLEYCFTLKEHNTSAVKHRTVLLELPIYSQFHPMQHFSLESIFDGFLRISDVAEDECIEVDKFSYVEKTNEQSLVRLKLNNIGGKLLKKSINMTDTFSIDKKGKHLIDMQKKIMPWRVTPPTEDVAMQSELALKRESRISELVLCAVLVEKIPNLGGLCRTAEIFGVSSLVLGSNRYLADQNFKSLSVSSERWIDIEQVLPIKLASWLAQKKNEGYHLIGAEQTANSKMIGDFKFPSKTILLLGNEKTGIPVDLIQLLDDCVEIPQLGIIRSLNVHISGALMVWEYCKQHMLLK